MATRPVFLLPEGLQLSIAGESLDLKYDGDVELGTTLGKKLGTVVVGGNLTLRLPGPVTGDLRVAGILTIEGELDAGHVHAGEIVLGRHNVKCSTLSADHRITIGPAVVAAEVIIAPDVVIDPKAQGRVTVIESQNERGATKIKGGFGLADYEDMFGHSAEFLAQRGLRPLGSGSPRMGVTPTERPTPSPEPHHEPRPVSRAPEPAPRAVSTPVPPPVHKTAPPPVEPPRVEPPKPDAKRPVKATDEEDTDDPLSLSFDDLEPLVDPNAGQPAVGTHPNDDLQQRLNDALGRILACYEGTDVPPAIHELRDLVSQRDYDALRQNITEVWNGLLGFHQKRGIRPHHQVTHAFNVIHGLVQ